MDKIYLKIINVVEEVTGATLIQLLTDKHEEYVSYRILLIQALHRLGYTDKSIADRLGFTRQGVCWLRNQFPMRIKFRFTLANHWQVIEKELQVIASGLC